MGVSDKGNGLVQKLWNGKFYILLALALMVAVAIGAHYYLLSNDRASQLIRQGSEDRSNYENLSANYSSLSASNDDLIVRYNNLSDMYNNTTADIQVLKPAYESLNSSLSTFQETGGPVMAVAYSYYKVGSGNDSYFLLNATAYNVGNRMANKFTLRVRVMYAGTPSVDEQVFTDVAPLDKVSYQWKFAPNTDLDAVWVDMN